MPAHRWGILVTIAALGAVVYFPSLKIPFLFDDYQIYLDHWPIVSWAAFGDGVLNHFQQNRLLTHVSWYIQMVVSGTQDPAAFHVFNIVLHIINTVIVYFFVRTLGSTSATGLLTAALFAVHPTNMETVSYIYGRSDLQVTMLLLLSLILLWRGRSLWLLSVICMAAAVLTKETAVVLPALYLSVVLILRKEDVRWEPAPFGFTVAVSAASLALFLLLKTDHADNFGYGIPHAIRYLMLQPFCLMIGLIRIIIPTGFSIVYHFALPEHFWNMRVVGPALFWAVITWVCVREYRKERREYLFALAWYMIAMSPTNSFVPRIDQISDRHLYLALIGPFWALSTAWERIMPKERGWVTAAACIAILLLGGSTFTRNVSWQSATSMWSSVVERFPDAYIARRELAAEWGRAGNARKEMEILEDVVRNNDFDWTSWNNLGVAYAAQKRRAQERHAYIQALKNAPKRHHALLYHNLGFSYQNDESIDSAMIAYRQALACDPNYMGSKHNLAMLLWQRGQLQPAEQNLREILMVSPQTDIARWHLATMYMIQKRNAEARQHLERLLSSPVFGENAERRLQTIPRE